MKKVGIYFIFSYNYSRGDKMKVLIVFDSYFGNTQKIAEAIFDVVQNNGELSSVNELQINEYYDLIVIGSPTRAFRPTKKIVSFAKNLRKEQLKYVAFFDTRMDIQKVDSKILTFMARCFGYSNDTLSKIFMKKRIPVLIEPGEFFVKDSEGPLFENEIDKAKRWINSAINDLSSNIQ